MKRLESILSNTLVDSQGERMTREALEQLAASVERSFIPIGVEHDPRLPPLGRIETAFVRERPDGEYEAVAIMELFEDDDEIQSPDDAREIVMARHDLKTITISHDWTHRNQEDQDDIAAIGKILKSKPIYEVKKAAEPISIISLVGAFMLGGIASGFLGQIGSDGWNAIKPRLKSIFSRRRKNEQLLTFTAYIEKDGYTIEVELIVSNPTGADIDQLVERRLSTIDKVLSAYLHKAPDIRRLVFEVKGDEVELLFGVRKDCRPLKATISVRQIIDASNNR